MKEEFRLTQDELKVFPNRKIYFQNLQYLDAYDFTGKSYKEIENTYFDNAIILPSSVIRQSKQDLSGLYFFRARLNIDNYDLGLVNTHSYPNSYFCKENGRCNLKGRSVMYCSDNPNAALYEVNPESGDTGYFSIWKANKDVIKFTSLLPPELPKGNKWFRFANESYSDTLNLWKKEYPNIFPNVSLLKAFLAEKFYAEKPPYNLSSFISNKLLYEDIYNDLIIYPSVKVNAFYCNMALHPNFVDEYLSLQKIVKFKVFEAKDSKYGFRTGKVADFKDGRISWRKRNSSDSDFFNFFEKVN